MRVNVSKLNGLILTIVLLSLIILLVGCSKKSEGINAKDVKEIKLEFIPGRGTDRTFVKDKNNKEITEFIDAYNKAQPYRNDYETTDPVIANLILENGEKIIIRGGAQSYQSVTKDKKTYNIKGEELDKYFKSLLKR